MSRVPTPAVAFLVAWIVLAVGCADSGGVKPVPVAGHVTWRGKPLTVGRIQFMPDDPLVGRPAFGDIDAGGAYRLTTFEMRDGVIPGSYRIQIYPFDYNAEVSAKIHTDFPEKFQNAQTSGLTAVVRSQREEQTIDFSIAK